MHVDLSDVDAVLFDLDGVLTPTAALHEAAWKRTLDQFLAERVSGEAARPFTETDYRLYVDGRPRLDGASSFLRSRGVEVPEGEPADAAGTPTVHGLARRKQELFDAALAAGQLEAFPGSVALVRRLRAKGTRTGVVSASRNCSAVLDAAGIADLFDVQVDGNVAARDGLRGKPAPDTFLAAAQALGVEPARCAVLEDAIAGVEAGRAGGFGLVVGVDRRGDGRDMLLERGADIVVGDPAELLPDLEVES